MSEDSEEVSREMDDHRPRRSPRSPGRRAHTKKTRLYRVALAALGAELFLAPQLFGGVFSWTIWAIAGLATISAITAAWAVDHDVGEIRMPLGVAVLGALVWTCIQAAPLPCGVVRALAPTAAEDAEATARLLGEPAPTMCTISRDPAATAEEVVKGAALFATFVAAAVLAAAGQRKSVFIVIASAIATLAFVALAHTVVGLREVFGVYRPVHTVPHLLSPLINENTLAGLLTLGVPIMLALGLREERDLALRVVWIAAAVVTAGCVVLTVSRGGIAALACTLAAFALLSWIRGRSERRFGRNLLAIGIVLVLGGGLGMFVASKDVVSDYAANDMRKIELTKQALLLALENPWTGVGRGAFSAAFVRHEGTFKRAIYPENIAAQWSSEWGIPIAVLIAAAFAAALARVLRRSRSSLKLAAAAAVIGIVIHDMFDLSLELLGVSTIAIALLAALVAPRQGRERDAAETIHVGLKLRWLTWIAAALAMFAVGFIGPRLPNAAVNFLNEDLTAKMQSGDRASFRSTLERAVRLHPSEPSFALLAGAEAARHSDPASLRWLSRAMRLAPGWASPHIEAARVLVMSGFRDQALLELQQAATYDSSSPVALACWILQTYPRVEYALRSAPTNENRILYLDNVASCLPAAHPAAQPIEAEITRLDASYPGPQLRRARAAISAGSHQEAIAALRPIVTHAPSNVDAVLLLGEALIGVHQPADAIRTLRAGERYARNPTDLVRMRARAEAARGNAEQMRASIDELRGLAGGSSHLLAAAMLLQANLESTLGNDGRAVAAYDEAYRFEADPQTLVALAAVAERLGNRSQALRTYIRLCELVPGNAAYQAERNRLQQSVSSPQFP